MDYRFIGHPIELVSHPIMSCLADQTRYDLEWKNHCFTAETLLEAILINLETDKVIWPGVSNFVSLKNKGEWIKNMRENPKWYVFNNVGLIAPQFIIEAEDLLSQCISISCVPHLYSLSCHFGVHYQDA